MKRMYVTLAILFAVVFWAGTILGQQGSRPVDDNDTDHMMKRMKMREEMHRRMMDKLLHGIGPDQDMFSDMESMMEEMMKDSFASGGMSSFSSIGPSNYMSEWQESTSGRTLIITPRDPKQQLDISINNGFVTIKGKVEKKSPNGISVSDFSNSFSVPGDCDAGRVKMDQKDGKILMHFPFHTSTKQVPKSKPERVPVPPSKDDVEI